MGENYVVDRPHLSFFPLILARVRCGNRLSHSVRTGIASGNPLWAERSEIFFP